MKTLKTSLLLAGLLTVSASFAQGGAPMSREQKNAAEQTIEAQARADKNACESLSGNAVDKSTSASHTKIQTLPGSMQQGAPQQGRC